MYGREQNPEDLHFVATTGLPGPRKIEETGTVRYS